MQQAKHLLLVVVVTVLFGQVAIFSQTPEKSNYPAMRPALMQADLVDVNGTGFRLDEYKGKVLLINLWGIWCGPCRSQMPIIVKLQKLYRDQGFEVIGLNVGDTDGDAEPVRNIKKFAKQMKLNYTLASSSNGATDAFYSLTRQKVVPQSLIVDREGRLRGVFVGGGKRVDEAMRTTVENIMKERPVMKIK